MGEEQERAEETTKTRTQTKTGRLEVMDGVTGSRSENKGIMRVLDKREIVKDLLEDSCRGNM